MILKNYCDKLICIFLEKSNSFELYFYFYLKKIIKILIFNIYNVLVGDFYIY